MIEKDHPLIKYGNTGVLVINLGTPDSTNWFDIRRYLREFLSDRRVIEVNPLIWQVILNLFILNFRPSKTAKAYKEIWMKDENMSPLLYYTKKQSEKISDLLSTMTRPAWKDFVVPVLDNKSCYGPNFAISKYSPFMFFNIIFTIAGSLCC